jgi:hypothetical protein
MSFRQLVRTLRIERERKEATQNLIEQSKKALKIVAAHLDDGGNNTNAAILHSRLRYWIGRVEALEKD